MGRSEGTGQENGSPGKGVPSEEVTRERPSRQSGKSSNLSPPEEAGQAFPEVASEAPIGNPGDVAAGENHVGGRGMLNWLAAPRGAALIGLLGLLVSLASLLTNVSFSRVSVLGPALFFFLIWVALRNRRRVIAAGLGILCLASLLLVVRVYTAPPVASFYYGGEAMEISGIPYATASDPVPLTDNPAQGYEVTSIQPDPNDSGTFDVSCTYQGIVDTGARSTDLEWAQITSGQFQSLWVPLPFLSGIAYGTARTLLPCSNWRWRLQQWELPGL
jgi:hypothetical protein